MWFRDNVLDPWSPNFIHIRIAWKHLLKQRWLDTTPTVSCSVGLWEDLRICISDKFPLRWCGCCWPGDHTLRSNVRLSLSPNHHTAGTSLLNPFYGFLLSTGQSPDCLQGTCLRYVPKKDVFFIIGDWNAKVGSQETPGVIGKFGLGVQNEAGQKLTVLPGERTGHSRDPLTKTLATALHMDITRWSTPKSDWLYSLQPKMEKLYTISKNKMRSWMWLRSWIPYCKIHT